MIFNLFKSKRQRLKDEGEAFFENFVATLKGMSGEEIGYVLDTAAGIKNTTTLYGTKKDELLLFEDPLMIPQEEAFETLQLWKIYMQENSASLEGLNKIGALSIWYLSILSTHVGELRIRGREMWGELERGFLYCGVFNPETDCVRGLEANFK